MFETQRILLLVLLVTCYQQNSSFRFAGCRRAPVSLRAPISTLRASEGDDTKAQIITSSLTPESEAEMDRLLIENDDDDDDGDEDESEVVLGTEGVEVQLEVELEEMDINMISESEIDRSIQNAVQKLVDSGPKEPELSRVETFENIYKNIKSKNSDPNVKLDHTSMLAALFSDTQRKDPFDEKKVMMKFRTMLKNEDFEGLFRDPLIGDFL